MPKIRTPGTTVTRHLRTVTPSEKPAVRRPPALRTSAPEDSPAHLGPEPVQHAAVPSPAGNGNTCYLSLETFLNTEKVQSKCGIKEKKWYLALTTNGTPRTGRCSVCVGECAGRRRGHDRAAGTLHTLPREPALLPRGRKSTRELSVLPANRDGAGTGQGYGGGTGWARQGSPAAGLSGGAERWPEAWEEQEIKTEG